MCTRFYIRKEAPELQEIIEQVQGSFLFRQCQAAGITVVTEGEARPADTVPVVASNRQGRLAVFPMRWGFRLANGRLLVNARTETAAVKPTFRDAWAGHRCIVPASWYYEWEHFTDGSGRQKTGAKYRIRPRDAEVTWLCGLYRLEEGLPAFTVLTREPNEALRRLHDRMPLILPRERTGEWIDPQSRPEDLLPYALTDLDFTVAD